MPSSINRGDVRRRLTRLRETYDPPVEEIRWRADPEEFDDFAPLARDGYTGGGYAWVVREEPKELGETMPEDVDERYPRVLLGLGRGDDGWGPAGGGRESEPRRTPTSSGDDPETGGETYEEAAVREVREETGIECEVVDCRHVRHDVAVRAGSDDEIHTLWVYFLAREIGGSLDVLESELNGAAWFHEVPDDLHERVADRPWKWAEWR